MSKRTVLIVDADPKLRTTLAKLLSNNGCLIQTADSGTAAMALIFDAAPDAVLLNPNLTDVDLDVFTDALHQQNPLAMLVLIQPPKKSRKSKLRVIPKSFTDSDILRAVGHC